jgi:hypothetical protein
VSVQVTVACRLFGTPALSHRSGELNHGLFVTWDTLKFIVSSSNVKIMRPDLARSSLFRTKMG